VLEHARVRDATFVNRVESAVARNRNNTAGDELYTVADQRRMSRAKNYFAWQGRLVKREIGQRVIEVGSGLGNFTGMLLDREAVLAVDKEETCIELLRQRYSDRENLQLLKFDIAHEDFSTVQRFRPDSCICLNVLEHVRDDLAALRNMRSSLIASGVIVLIVPAFQSLYGPIDRNLGHHRRYTRSSMTRLAASAGLRVKKCHYMNAVGFFGWWANSHLFKKESQSERQIGVFDQYVVPIQSKLEQWLAPPFGQSLFVVLQKP
jgi:2-polyprenyl-3-methyl-5-hydroxy-6-metoxy-1,4-benzoquinol methylase